MLREIGSTLGIPATPDHPVHGPFGFSPVDGPVTVFLVRPMSTAIRSGSRTLSADQLYCRSLGEPADTGARPDAAPKRRLKLCTIAGGAV